MSHCLTAFVEVEAGAYWGYLCWWGKFIREFNESTLVRSTIIDKFQQLGVAVARGRPYSLEADVPAKVFDSAWLPARC